MGIPMQLADPLVPQKYAADLICADCLSPIRCVGALDSSGKGGQFFHDVPLGDVMRCPDPFHVVVPVRTGHILRLVLDSLREAVPSSGSNTAPLSSEIEVMRNFDEDSQIPLPSIDQWHAALEDEMSRSNWSELDR